LPFVETNRALGLPPSFRFGRLDIDDDRMVEQRILVPWPKDPAASYLYYECNIDVVLDSGIVVHNRLPQYNDILVDTLAYVPLDDRNIDKITDGGVNLKSHDQYRDIIQRMGHARYWFHLWGRAMRAGYRVPIPGIRTIGGVVAIPHDANPQRARNSIAPGGSYGGVILWYAQWSLWYTTAVPPYKNEIPEADVAAHIVGSAPLPDAMQAPYSQADDNSRRSGPER